MGGVRSLLTIVRPDTFVRWHREGFRLFWRWKSRRRGRPRIPVELQQLIADMASANRTWCEERIAAELRLKLGLMVSPRTVRRYMPRRPRPGGNSQRAQSWATFLRNHAGAVLACDFFVVVTAAFQRVCVFVIVDIATRRIVYWNLTQHPTADWTIQQFRNGLPIDGASRLLVHDRDGIFAPAVDDALASMSLRVLKTPVRTPQANAHCERFIGSARRECLDWLIPLNERHLRRAAEWIPHYNGERPTCCVGSRTAGRTDPPGDVDRAPPPTRASRCRQCSARWPASRLPRRTRRGVSFCGAPLEQNVDPTHIAVVSSPTQPWSIAVAAALLSP
jgi:transposase InsO family protein